MKDHLLKTYLFGFLVFTTQSQAGLVTEKNLYCKVTCEQNKQSFFYSNAAKTNFNPGTFCPPFSELYLKTVDPSLATNPDKDKLKSFVRVVLKYENKFITQVFEKNFAMTMFNGVEHFSYRPVEDNSSLGLQLSCYLGESSEEEQAIQQKLTSELNDVTPLPVDKNNEIVDCPPPIDPLLNRRGLETISIAEVTPPLETAPSVSEQLHAVKEKIKKLERLKKTESSEDLIADLDKMIAPQKGSSFLKFGNCTITGTSVDSACNFYFLYKGKGIQVQELKIGDIGNNTGCLCFSSAQFPYQQTGVKADCNKEWQNTKNVLLKMIKDGRCSGLVTASKLKNFKFEKDTRFMTKAEKIAQLKKLDITTTSEKKPGLIIDDTLSELKIQFKKLKELQTIAPEAQPVQQAP